MKIAKKRENLQEFNIIHFMQKLTTKLNFFVRLIIKKINLLNLSLANDQLINLKKILYIIKSES